MKVYEESGSLASEVELWKKILRLQDWDTKVEIVRASSLNEGSQGQCSWVLSRKEAKISLLDPIDYNCKLWPQDHEVTLVHELLHLHFAHVEEASNYDEQAIVAISQALVKLRRGC